MFESQIDEVRRGGVQGATAGLENLKFAQNVTLGGLLWMTHGNKHLKCDSFSKQ